MKKQIKFIGNTVITPFGSFVSGDIATLDAHYADHLIELGAAELHGKKADKQDVEPESPPLAEKPARKARG